MKSPVWEGVTVFLWAGLSAVIPLIIVWMEHDPRWAALIPFVNALAYAGKVAYENRKQ